ncbi:hypothetical protein [Puniceibacterium sp. IMCC21224]|uniref:hypothetical protein n=1 Tax=Puniceibacterium sp. IMCC21224 TaxID=1618204 RepID=UPI00064D8925|nr:hypothetical protein [Puniceibacterium sp. IMCC21224]KMK65024.1 hypothetical protein IMCC21224_12269 [Puniceibacterium sp. IMCC21224]
MFRRLAGPVENTAALERIEVWVRARFSLDRNCLVLVSEEETAVPGLPPRDTVVRFRDQAGERYRLRVFKPARAVEENDLPVGWLLTTLKDTGEPDCC